MELKEDKDVTQTEANGPSRGYVGADVIMCARIGIGQMAAAATVEAVQNGHPTLQEQGIANLIEPVENGLGDFQPEQAAADFFNPNTRPQNIGELLRMPMLAQAQMPQNGQVMHDQHLHLVDTDFEYQPNHPTGEFEDWYDGYMN